MSILAAGLIAGGASLLSGIFGASAASKAAKAQAQANKEATAESRRQFDEQMKMYQSEQAAANQRYSATQSALSPYTNAGSSALDQMRALMGLGPDKSGMISSAESEYAQAVAAAEEQKKKYLASQPAAAAAPTGSFGLSAGNADALLKTAEMLRAKEKASTSSAEKASFARQAETAEAKAKEIQTYNQTTQQQAASSTGQADTDYNAAVAAAAAKKQAAIDAANALPSGSDAQKAAIAAIEQGSEFQTLSKQGEEGILQNASATGGLRGGNTQGALAQFRPSLLNSLINQQYERLGGMSQMGMSSVLGGAGVSSGGSTPYPNGSNITGLMQESGAIDAGAALAGGNALQSIPGALMTGLGVYGGLGGFNPSTTGNMIAGDMSQYQGNWEKYGGGVDMQGTMTSPF